MSYTAPFPANTLKSGEIDAERGLPLNLTKEKGASRLGGGREGKNVRAQIKGKDKRARKKKGEAP